MAARQLSPDIISLIHHVQLNEAGWWRKAVGQVVQAVFWNQDGPLGIKEAAHEFRRLVGIELDEHQLRQHVDLLLTQSVLQEQAGGFTLREEARLQMNAAHSAAAEEYEQCKDAFLELCDELCPGLHSNEVWDSFSKALSFAVRTTGANLFHLVAGDRILREIDWASLLINKFEPDHREQVRGLLAKFLGKHMESCKSVILRHLSAHFFAEAARLTPDAIAAIERGRGRRQIKVVLDTNFIFSILGLHDNPGDDSAISLINLAGSPGSHFEVKLYVLTGTLEEAKRTLIYQQGLVERIRTQPNVAKAALNSPLPSIARKYFATAKEAGGISADAYFSPYISELRTILRGRGIHVLESSPLISTRQDVVDDTLGEQERENTERAEHRRKGYDKILHDVVLWHSVNDRRQDNTTDPFEVEYWGVTIDWALIGFDGRRRREGRTRLPVVLHPSNLLQLIQFWVPRSDALEVGLIDTLRLPLIFQSFDPEDEKATIKILEAISRFENVDDIPEDTLRVVLANQALRTRLKSEVASNEQIFELVRDELIREHRETVEALESTRGELEISKKRGEEHLAFISEANRVINDTKGRIDHLETSLREGEDHKARLAARLKRQERQNFILLFAVLPTLVGALLCMVVAMDVLSWGFSRIERVFYGAASALLFPAVAFGFAPFYLTHKDGLGEWSFARGVCWLGKKAVLLPLGLALVAVLQGAVWEFVKPFFFGGG